MADSNREEIAKLEALYANNPAGRVFTHLAEAYRKAGNLERARDILEQGITRHADSASAHVVLGRVLSDLGARPEAANSFQRVLQLDPENRVALRWLGDLARQGGKTQEALTYYRQLRHLDPSDEEIAAAIDELTSQPATPAFPVEPTDEEVETEMAAWEATEPALTRDLPPVTSSTPIPVSPDFALDWNTQEEEVGLPGDLAQLAREAEDVAPVTAGAVDEAPTGYEFPPDIPDLDGAAPQETEVAAPEPEAFELADYGLTEADAVEPEGVVISAEIVEETATDLPVEATFEELLSSNNGGAGPLAVAAQEPELPTETLADLYRSQGFTDRAAEVYRALLQERPGDAELESKLREVEMLQVPASEPELFRESGAAAELPEFAGIEPVAEEFMPSLSNAAAEEAALAEEPPSIWTEVEPTIWPEPQPATPSSEVEPAREPLFGWSEAAVVEEEAAAWSGAGAAEEPSAAWSEEAPEPETTPEVEAEAPAALQAAAEEPQAEAEAPQAAEAWMEGVASGWTERDAASADAATMYAWSDEAAEDEPGGVTLGDYLKRVLAWRPTAPPPPPPEPVSTAPIVMGYAEATGAPATEPPPPPVEEARPAPGTMPGLEPAAPMPWEEPVLEAETLVIPGAIDPDTAPARVLRDKEPPQAAAAPPPRVAPGFQRPASGGPVEDAFDEWFSGGGTVPSPEPVVAPGLTITQPQDSGDSGEASEESDDDLEMFRSWLQSLKR